MAATERSAMRAEAAPLGRLREQLQPPKPRCGWRAGAAACARHCGDRRALGGGFSRGALHEIAAAREADTAAATGFALGWRRAAARTQHRRRDARRADAPLSPCGRGLRAATTRMGEGSGRTPSHPSVDSARPLPRGERAQTAPRLAAKSFRRRQPSSGSPRISRSPRTARPMDPVSTRPALRPNG